MNFLKKESIPDDPVMQEVAAIHATPQKSFQSAGVTTGITSAIAGVVLGVAVMVLYQKLDKKPEAQTAQQPSSQQQQAGDQQTEVPTLLAANAAPRQGIASKKSISSTKPKQAKEAKPPYPLKDQPLLPTPIQPGLLPLLPAPKTTPLKLQPFSESAFRRQSSEEKEDGEGGVHIELDKSRKDSSKASKRMDAPEPDTKLPEPNQGAGVAVQISGAKKTNPDPATKDEKQPETQSAPKFKVLERQGDGLLIRVGNQVRFVAAGAMLPDGTKVEGKNH